MIEGILNNTQYSALFSRMTVIPVYKKPKRLSRSNWEAKPLSRDQ